MSKVRLEKGHSAEVFSIPDSMVMGTLMGEDLPGLPPEIICQEVAAGIKQWTPRDIHHKKVAIIVPDDTRLWARGEMIVPVIVNTLMGLGVPAHAITILIALGTHADVEPEGFVALVGKACVGKVQILNSANKNQDRLVDIGLTDHGTRVSTTREAWDADHVIIFGGVLHHLIAGFGGGRKYILPGIAGYDAIQQNHSLAFLADGSPHPMVRQASLLKNPVHEDMEAAAQLFFAKKTSTYVTVAANGMGEIFFTSTGPVTETFEQGCRQVDRACTVTIDQQADFALISAGGHKTDGQLYQATKALVNAVNAVKEGGQILFVAQARDGIGNPIFGEMLKEYNGCPEKIGSRLVKQFNMPSYVAFRVMDLLKRFDITLVSEFSPQETRELGFKYTNSLEYYVSTLTGKGYIIPFAENILPIFN